MKAKRRRKTKAVKEWPIERLPVATLMPADYNPRSISPEALDGLEASVTTFGMVEPIVYNRRTGHVVGGHQRLKILQRRGVPETDVVVVDLPEEKERALNVVLNNPAITGDFTVDVGPILEEAKRDLGDLFEGLRLDQLADELEELLAGAEDELDAGGGMTDPGPEEPPEEPITQEGDVWTLGEHRLMCGDSTKPEDVEELMAGESVSLLATDPPYLVDYDGTNHPSEHTKRKTGRTHNATGNPVGNKHWDAYVDHDSSVEFFRAYLAAALPHLADRVPIYQWHATRRQALVEAAWRELDLLIHQTIVWVKSRGVLTRSHMLWRHEPCFYGWVKGRMPKKGRRPPTTATTVWEIGNESDGIHPTQKPLEIFERPIQWHTRRGEICYEPFSGSGSQIIAAERLGRRCFAMELSPGFVDAAIGRWEKMTGDTAQLENR